MSGMISECTSFCDASFASSFKRQMEFQQAITGESLPCDSLTNFKYHVLAMVEEMGEVMKADKRWKTFRNTRYEKEEKLDELADVIITAMNLAMYSGFSYQDIEVAVYNKITENFERLNRVDK